MSLNRDWRRFAVFGGWDSSPSTSLIKVYLLLFLYVVLWEDAGSNLEENFFAFSKRANLVLCPLVVCRFSRTMALVNQGILCFVKRKSAIFLAVGGLHSC